MTKYSKLISFLLFCILTLFGFGLYQSSERTSVIPVELITETGTETDLDSLHFLGTAHNLRGAGRSTPFEYKNGNINYIDDLSLLERADFSYTPVMNRYIRDYRSFMRGITRQANHFTETEEHIIYTAMASDVDWRLFNDNTLSISLFDKNTEETRDYEVDLMDGFHFGVVASYIDYPSLTLIVQGSNDNLENEWLIYSFNFGEPEDELHPIVNVGRTVDSSNIQFGYSQNKTERYIPFRTLIVGKTDEYDYDYEMEHEPSGYFVFDTQSQEIKEIPPSEEGDRIVLVESDTIIVGNDQGDDILWSEWGFEDESFTQLGTTVMTTPTIGRVPVHFYSYTFNQGLQLIDGHIYAFEENTPENNGRPLFQKIELETLETVFSGYFGSDTEQSTNQIEIFIYDYIIDSANN